MTPILTQPHGTFKDDSSRLGVAERGRRHAHPRADLGGFAEAQQEHASRLQCLLVRSRPGQRDDPIPERSVIVRITFASAIDRLCSEDRCGGEQAWSEARRRVGDASAGEAGAVGADAGEAAGLDQPQ